MDAGIRIWKSKWKIKNRTAEFLPDAESGFWNTIVTADVNEDGKPDILAGNLGLNTQIRISKKEPAEMYYADFDGNGLSIRYSVCICRGKKYPYLTRDELIGQLPVMRKRFSNFKTYADVTMDELFDKSALNNAGHLQATQTETVLYLSTADGKWVKSSLPAEVQYSPAYAFEPLDFNGDGHLDILFGGNSGSAKIRLGKMDASYGGLLQGYPHGFPI